MLFNTTRQTNIWHWGVLPGLVPLQKMSKKIKNDLKEYSITVFEFVRCSGYETLTGPSIFNLFGEILGKMWPPMTACKRGFSHFSCIYGILHYFK